MIISISGPSSTGKTTLLHALQTQVDNCLFQEESFRLFIKDKNINFNDPVEAFNFQVDLSNYMNNVIHTNMYYSNYTHIISDRCLFDSIVYSLLHFNRLSNQIIYMPKLLEIISIYLKQLKYIDKIFLTFGTNEVEDDHVRPRIYAKLRQEELYLFRHLSSLLNQKICMLPSTTKERIQTIQKYLNSD